MKVACLQIDVLHCKKSENLEKALKMALQAVKAGAELLVLPELFSTGFCYEKFDEVSESAPFPTLEKLAEFSETWDCILIGSILEKEASEKGPAYYNLGFCLESGGLCGTHRKIHPFNAENHYFSKGNTLEPIFLKKRKLTVGLEICYEVRFPEIARKLALAGSDLLVTIAAFPEPRAAHWNTLTIARAIENQLPHIVCNRTGASPDNRYFGNSMVLDAWGEVKADAGRRECVIVHDLDLAKKDEVRKAIPVFKDRRTELY